MTDIPALIAKLEGLSGADREVDAEIAATLRVPQNKAPAWIVRWAGAYAVYRGTKVALKHQDGSTGVWWSPQPFTASLDDAVALFKMKMPGWSWECRQSGTGDQGQATIWNPSRRPGDNEQQRAYNCANPAIALLIALLRSLSQEGGGG